VKPLLAIRCAVVLGLLAFELAPQVAAQDIFKCVDNGATAYQSTPCAPGAAETRIATTGASTPRPDVEMSGAAISSMREPRRVGPWSHATLTLGMSDDEVLNMSGWGRPSRISRTRAPHEWREEWIYGQATGGERHLYFANARLVDIAVTPPVDQLVQLAPQ